MMKYVCALISAGLFLADAHPQQVSAPTSSFYAQAPQYITPPSHLTKPQGPPPPFAQYIDPSAFFANSRLGTPLQQLSHLGGAVPSQLSGLVPGQFGQLGQLREIPQLSQVPQLGHLTQLYQVGQIPQLTQLPQVGQFAQIPGLQVLTQEQFAGVPGLNDVSHLVQLGHFGQLADLGALSQLGQLGAQFPGAGFLGGVIPI